MSGISNFLIFDTSTPLWLHYTKLLLTPCHAATTPVTKVPAMTIALGPLVLLNKAPAKNPDIYGVTECGTGVQASRILFQVSNVLVKGTRDGERVYTHQLCCMSLLGHQLNSLGKDLDE